MPSDVVLVPCKLCKTKVPVNDLRRNKDGLYVCGSCLSHGYYGIPALREVTQTRIPLQSLQSTSTKVQPTLIKKEQKVNYICNSCKYSFTKPLGSEDKNCPNCGKDYGVEKKQSAAELLREVEDMFGE